MKTPNRTNLTKELPGFSSLSGGRVLLFRPNSWLSEFKCVHNWRQADLDDIADFDQAMLILETTGDISGLYNCELRKCHRLGILNNLNISWTNKYILLHIAFTHIETYLYVIGKQRICYNIWVFKYLWIVPTATGIIIIIIIYIL
jgi:hypothetical protein